MYFHTIKRRVPLHRYFILLPVYFIISVISSSFYFFYVRHPQSDSFISQCKPLKFIITPLFFISVTMLLYSHYISMTTSNEILPRKIPQCDADKSNSLSICKKCYNIRPLRAHHCALCNVCIRKMDHHCPWIVNCVGESNQKSFCLLLFYSALSSFLSSLCLYKEFMYIITNQAEINKRVIITTVKEQLLSSLYYTLPILGFVLSVAGLVIMLSLIISQLNWIQFNMTLIESKMYPKKYECPFFENNFPKHFTLLFGKGITMLVPTVVSDNSIYDEEERQSLI